MSFLKVIIPAESLKLLKHDIYRQFAAGGFRAIESCDKEDAAPELAQLIHTLEERLNRDFGIYNIVNVTYRRDYELKKRSREACVLCLKCNKAGPATWTDGVRECPVEHDTVLFCEEGYLYAESLNHGGIYLILWPPVDEPEEDTGLEQEPSEQPAGNHGIDDGTVKSETMSPETAPEHYQSPMVLWEKLDKEIQRRRKRPWDLMAHPELEDEDGEDGDVDGLKTNANRDGRMQLMRVEYQIKKRKTR
ncbi:RNA polymerase II subunit A C-terminal domain phosphatase [Hypoxylon texense]